MKNRKKKGFTIVELVIIISVIAILAAVLIPTFASIISEANNAAAQSELRQIQTLIEIELADDNLLEFVIRDENYQSVMIKIIRNADGTLSVTNADSLADALNSYPALDGYGDFSINDPDLIYTTKNQAGKATWSNIVGSVITNLSGSATAKPTITYEQLKFQLDNDGQSYTLMGRADSDYIDIVIPDTLEDGKLVTSIHYNAFDFATNVTSIEIPNSITNISATFKGCTNLKSIKVADDNENYCAVDGNLYSKDKTVILLYAKGKTDTSFEIPDTVKCIAGFAFYNCENLTSVTIGNNVTSIGSNAFVSCNGFTDLTIGNNIETISLNAFLGCNNLTKVTIEDSVQKIESGAFSECHKLESVTIGNRVTTIGDRAFYKCTSLETITLGSSITSIGDSAFLNCHRLKDINIPNSVTDIADSAFQGCSNLNYTEHNNGKYIGSDENPYLVLLGVKDISVTSFEISSQTKVICTYAFSDCKNLTAVSIPEGVKSIGKYTFQDCLGLESIIIPESVTYIYVNAFMNCPKLTSVRFTQTTGWKYFYSVYEGDRGMLGVPSIKIADIPSSDLSNPTDAATHLTSKSNALYWERS